MAENRTIGKDNSLPWHLSEDLKYFRKVTTGHCIIMGRKTWESIGRPLPGRTNIVITRTEDYQADGARVVNSLEAAIELAQSVCALDGVEEAFIIGGAGLYHLMDFDESQWSEISRDKHLKSETNPYDYSICLLERIAS